MVPPTVPEPLWTFLYGRRRHARHDVRCEAVLHGPSLPLACRIADISSGGMLLHVRRSTLIAPKGQASGLVALNFGPSFRVDLLATDIHVEAALARLAWRPDDDDHVYAGCRFLHLLDGRTLRRLGIEPEADPGDATRPASTCMPLGAGDGEAFRVVLGETGGDARQPLFEGSLLGAGRNTLAVHLPDAELDAVASALDDRDLVVAVHRGLAPMWTVRARPMMVRPLPEPDPGVEVVVLADSTPAALLTADLVATDDVA